MIVALVFLGTLFGTIAAGAMLAMGEPWWVALAGYAATGVISILLMALTVAFVGATRPSAAEGRTRLGAGVEGN